MHKLLHGTTRMFTTFLLSIPCIFSYGDDGNISPTINQDVPQWGIRIPAYAEEAESVYDQTDAFSDNATERDNVCDTCVDRYVEQNFGECCADPCNVCSRYHDNALQTIECCDSGGIWLPEDPPLFRPFMADPREVCYSVGWRFNDNALTKNIIDVSFGDSLAIYRWCDVWPLHGQLQFEIEGAVWAIFDPCQESAPLINADYYVGFPLSYAIDRWQFRLRPFHISSHIGDEFLLNHPGFDRRNASNEYVDFFVSFDMTPEIRFY
jgi:hypothetical protein